MFVKIILLMWEDERETSSFDDQLFSVDLDYLKFWK